MKLELFAPTERPIRQRPHLRSDRLVEPSRFPFSSPRRELGHGGRGPGRKFVAKFTTGMTLESTNKYRFYRDKKYIYTVADQHLEFKKRLKF